MSETLLFYVLGGLATVASALVIGQRNPMYSVLLLIVSFAALAGLYIQLDGDSIDALSEHERHKWTSLKDPVAESR